METNEHPEIPDPQIHAQHNRKLYILTGLAGVVIVLLWVATLPWNFHSEEESDGAGALFSQIGDTVSVGFGALINQFPSKQE